MIYYSIIVLASVLLDQLIKFWVVSNIKLHQTVFDNQILSLTHIRNSGAAWSILEGKIWFFTIVTIIALIILPYLLYKYHEKSKWMTIGLSLIIGGTLGNFIDRIRLGYVVDMFQVEFFNFPIFNFADVSLVIGVLCIFIYILFFEEEIDLK
ncbi:MULTISPECIES: signal peptidase II [Vagococcus]|uniref:Lipoprotein signal peptidase n=1 Tax=Vagococcus fluvialis bH819 TaxID=1255619 RepID=A0A1X6WSE6_9ENTE|nr:MULTISPECIES: signal peptidase II [Vagococcus]SLM87169.1 Lipoprotein signal peptidase [Vagococcus fluvialis bH819]HCM90098.1 signal peptidase II [Vagococcus sp.]